MRALAAEALGALRAEAAVPALLEALEDEEEWVRTRAAEALGAVGSEAAIGPLVQYANRWEGEHYERVVAIRSVLQIAESPRAAARPGRVRQSHRRTTRPRTKRDHKTSRP